MKKKITPAHQPAIIPRSEHDISRKNISPFALKVLYHLKDAGYEAYLVGGSVRDLLLGLHPKDFDIATNAHPEQVRKLFHHSRLIGRRFRIVHVFSGKQIVEVTTFRKGASEDTDETHHGQNEHGMLLRDNIFGTIEDDAVRRDFTVNALYYNIKDFSVVDFVHGVTDLREGVMRLIGEPEVRFREDPVRMLRAIRLANKVGFHLDQAILDALPKMYELLQHVSRSRLFDEFIKILTSGKSSPIFEDLLQYNLLSILLPSLPNLWADCKDAEALANQGLKNTDSRIQQNKSINPAFMLSVLYWPQVSQRYKKESQYKQSKAMAFEKAVHFACHIALQDLSIPKRLLAQMREIWDLQRRFSGAPHVRLINILELPKFRAAYDFLLLRAEVNSDLLALSEWWTNFYESEPNEREMLLKTKPVLKNIF